MNIAFKTLGSPGGQMVNGVIYLLDTSSGVFRPAYSSDFAGGGGGTTSSVALTGFNPNLPPLPVSGAFAANNADVVLAISSGNLLLSGVSGLLASNLTDPAAVTVTGWNTGLVVRTQPSSSSIVGNLTPSGATPFTSSTTFFGQALAANPNRLEMFIQNVHTGTPLYVTLGTTPAGTGSFSMILNPSTVLGWAGTSYGSDRWRGAVQASGGAWIAWEL